MFDDSLMLIDGDTDGSLTTTGTYSGIEVDESPVGGFCFQATVPAAAGTGTPTLGITIQQADTDADGSYVDLIVFTDITEAGPYSVRAAVSMDYVRASVAISGTNPDFGAVSLGIVPNLTRFWKG